jgi:hypothetical protein
MQLEIFCEGCGRKYIQWSVMKQKLADDDAKRLNEPKGGFLCP